MLSPAVAFVKTPPLVSTQFCKFDNNRRTHFCNSAFLRLNLKESKIEYRNCFRVMAAESLEAGILDGGGGSDEHISPAVSALEQEALIENHGVSFHRTPGGLHAIINLMSKWIVAVSFGGFLFSRRDALALWAAMGSVINMMLSITLKQILKQERPVSRVNSGHGMPSSHAQAIFYTIVCIILTLIEYQGFGGVTAIVSMFVVATGSYFSWLRVSQRYHTAIQVIVGAIVGSVFAMVWFWAWEAVVYKVYESNLVVRVLVMVGAVGFTLGFLSHVFRHWLKGED